MWGATKTSSFLITFIEMESLPTELVPLFFHITSKVCGMVINSNFQTFLFLLNSLLKILMAGILGGLNCYLKNRIFSI